MRDFSDETRQAEAKGPGAKPAWSAPGFEVLNIDQTANFIGPVPDISIFTTFGS